MRFIIFVIDSDSSSGSKDEMHEIDNFNSELSGNNQLVMAAGIAGSSHGLLIDNRGTKELVESGSMNGAEFYSGFWIIDAESERHARELALEGSRACNRRVELRPFL
ncbi:MAG: hypothetical protein ACO3S3_12585 [Pseudohongiellaceae bacterium]